MNKRMSTCQTNNGSRPLKTWLKRLFHFMNFKNKYTLPDHLEDGRGLPRNNDERLLWIKSRVEKGYYDTERVLQAVAEAFMDPPEVRRAGDQAVPSQNAA